MLFGVCLSLSVCVYAVCLYLFICIPCLWTLVVWYKINEWMNEFLSLVYMESKTLKITEIHIKSLWKSWRKHDNIFSRFDTVPACDRRTDRSITCFSIADARKNASVFLLHMKCYWHHKRKLLGAYFLLAHPLLVQRTLTLPYVTQCIALKLTTTDRKTTARQQMYACWMQRAWTRVCQTK